MASVKDPVLLTRICTKLVRNRRQCNAVELQRRIFHQCRRCMGIWGGFRPNEWNKAVSEAEKIVGYPTSFMSLRLLLSDEISNVAISMRKLVGTKHPLLKTARRFLTDEKNSMQTRGLIVLLMSKAAGPSSSDVVTEQMVSGIYPSQRNLAEITEMIHTASLIHKGILNLSDIQPAENSLKDLEFGNKMAILCGDFLLANACTGLAKLQNTKVVEIIASAIRDIATAEFSVLRNKDGNPQLPPEGATIAEWQNQTYLSVGSLISKSCQATLELAQQSDDLQTQGAIYGENMAFARQLHEDLESFINPRENGDRFNIASAPVILFRNDSKSLEIFSEYSQEGTTDAKKKLYTAIRRSSAVQEALQMRHEYGQKACQALTSFPNSDSKTALSNIVSAITKL